MAKLSGLADYFDPGLTLEVPGADGVEREYVIPLASAELGLWCQMVAELAGEITKASTAEEIQAVTARIDELPDPDSRTMAQRTLGDAYDRMTADGVSHAHIQYCGATAYAWIVGGEEAAERYWKSGGHPEAPRPANRQERRAAGRTSTAAAAATPRPGSTSGTRSQKTSSSSGRAKASPGRKSSPTGR
jgi:hypothetical protein